MFAHEENIFEGFGKVMEACAPKPKKPKQSYTEIMEAMTNFADSQTRSNAMSIAISFINDGDYTPDYLQAMLSGFVDMDEEEEMMSDDESAEYVALSGALVDAFVTLGGSRENATAAIAGNADAAMKLGDYLSTKMDESPMSDDELIARFAVSPDDSITESVERVVVGGKVTNRHIPTHKKVLSAKQRASLKKARMKSHTGTANAMRAKSMRMRNRMGM